jgi:hypothetical protein
MIKAFIVVNNHAMVRLCRFYEQLVSLFLLYWHTNLSRICFARALSLSLF